MDKPYRNAKPEEIRHGLKCQVKSTCGAWMDAVLKLEVIPYYGMMLYGYNADKKLKMTIHTIEHIRIKI